MNRTGPFKLTSQLVRLARLASVVGAFSAGTNLAIADNDFAILAAAAYGGNSQAQAVCYIYNVGKTPVTIVKKEFTREKDPVDGSGSFPPLGPITWDTCVDPRSGRNVQLLPKTFCAYVANIPHQGGTGCIVELSPNGENVRGILEIRDAGNSIVNSISLR